MTDINQLECDKLFDLYKNTLLKSYITCNNTNIPTHATSSHETNIGMSCEFVKYGFTKNQKNRCIEKNTTHPEKYVNTHNLISEKNSTKYIIKEPNDIKNDHIRL